MLVEQVVDLKEFYSSCYVGYQKSAGTVALILFTIT